MNGATLLGADGWAATRIGPLALVLAGCSTNVDATPRQDGDDGATVVTTEVDVAANDVTIHMWVSGGDASSPALVLLNGGPEDFRLAPLHLGPP